MMRDVMQLTAEERVQHRAKWGGYNDAPVGFREVTPAEFVDSRASIYAADLYEIRQIWDMKSPALSVQMFFMPDRTGWAMMPDRHSRRVRYFLFGCEHRYRELSMAECRERGVYHAGRCYHVRLCERCGYISAVDTSD